MELESLKYVWHTMKTPAVAKDESAHIRALLKKRSGGLVARMRRNLFGELILIAATYTPAILFYSWGFNGRLSPIAWLLVTLMALLVFYFYRKNLLLKEMLGSDSHLRSHLLQLTATLKKYTRFYTLAGTLMIPVMTILSWFIIRRAYPPAPGAALYYRVIGITWWRQPLLWLGLLVPLTIGIYYINTWYVHRLYGRHIRKLQDLLREMEED